MRDTIALMRLVHELAIWRRVPGTFQHCGGGDDDCREPTWQLDRLLEVRHDIPSPWR